MISLRGSVVLAAANSTTWAACAGPARAASHSRAPRPRWRAVRLRAIERLGRDRNIDDLLQAAAPKRGEEAGAPTGVAGDALLVDLKQHGILVAVEAELDQRLHLAGTLALAPQRAARARPVADPACAQRLLEGLAVHPGEHQHLAGVELLGDGRNEPCGVEAQARQHRRDLVLGGRAPLRRAARLRRPDGARRSRA